MVAIKARSHLGVGLYSLPEAARILGVRRTNVARWANPQTGLVPRILRDEEETLTFIELMELHFIAKMRAAGISMPMVRLASAVAAKGLKSQYPFSTRQFNLQGKSILMNEFDERPNATEKNGHGRGTRVFDDVLQPFIRKLEYGPSAVVRYWPLEKSGRIVLDPQRKLGQPIDCETGVPTRAIFDAVLAGQDASTVADWLGIPLAAVEAAVTFEESLGK